MDIVPYKVSNDTSNELALTHGKQPILQFVDLIIRYAKETGDFGQYTSLNILSSELGDRMVNTLSEYKKAAIYENTYLMDEIIMRSSSNITAFLKSLGEFLVCDSDIELKGKTIKEMGPFFVSRYTSAFENVKQNTFDIENERVYWEEIKFKLQSIFQKNMNFMINKHKQASLPWYKKLFISDAPREEENTSRPLIVDRATQQTINRMCIGNMNIGHQGLLRRQQFNNGYTIPRGMTSLSRIQNRRFC